MVAQVTRVREDEHCGARQWGHLQHLQGLLGSSDVTASGVFCRAEDQHYRALSSEICGACSVAVRAVKVFSGEGC